MLGTAFVSKRFTGMSLSISFEFLVPVVNVEGKLGDQQTL